MHDLFLINCISAQRESRLKSVVLSVLTGLCLSTQALAFNPSACQGVHFDYCDTNSDLPGYRYTSTLSYGQELDVLTEAEPRLPLHLQASPDEDWDYLKEQTYTILGLSVATVGFMTLLPESVTNWDEDDRDMSRLASKWWDNVSSGPVWDKDDHFLNYVMHPYFGGVYYTAARHAGYDEWKSFMYSFTMSTFFWEYGVEAFAEVPSIQDIIVTPIFGAAVGELMYQKEQDILANGGEVWGSKSFGSFNLFLLNPVGHIHYWITDWWQDDVEVNMNYTPWFGNRDATRFALDAGARYDSQFVGMEVKLKW
ncbi:DUF3943 domain-containing protein [Thaumasiovibrio subtropicus]|uniref:DUF3943 domain-containing protein n=1 Tax=Thaumasiovibrio subtropicus TaxID=1891207 RepID=UPI000B359B93|nr:DUF3943 domain-containing protein [Thaumasiovibrio subtropicus]